MHHEHSIKTKQKKKKKGHGYAILMYTYIAIYFIHKKWNGNFNLYTIMLLTAKRKRKAVALTETKQGHFLHYSTIISKQEQYCMRMHFQKTPLLLCLMSLSKYFQLKAINWSSWWQSLMNDSLARLGLKCTGNKPETNQRGVKKSFISTTVCVTSPHHHSTLQFWIPFDELITSIKQESKSVHIFSYRYSFLFF